MANKKECHYTHCVYHASTGKAECQFANCRLNDILPTDDARNLGFIHTVARRVAVNNHELDQDEQGYNVAFSVLYARPDLSSAKIKSYSDYLYSGSWRNAFMKTVESIK